MVGLHRAEHFGVLEHQPFGRRNVFGALGLGTLGRRGIRAFGVRAFERCDMVRRVWGIRGIMRWSGYRGRNVGPTGLGRLDLVGPMGLARRLGAGMSVRRD